MEISYQSFTQNIIYKFLDSLFSTKPNHYDDVFQEINSYKVVRRGTTCIQSQGDLIVALKPLLKIMTKHQGNEAISITDKFIKECLEMVIDVSRVEFCGTNSLKLFLNHQMLLTSCLPFFVENLWTTDLLSPYAITIETPQCNPDDSLTAYRCHLIGAHLRRVFETCGALVENRGELQESATRGTSPCRAGSQNEKVSAFASPTELDGERREKIDQLATRPLCFQVSDKFESLSDASSLLLCSSVVDRGRGTKLDMTLGLFVELLKSELEAASYDKYETADSDTWDNYLTNLARSCLTLQLMAVHHLSPVKVSTGDCTNNTRASAFLLYNHARLCALFRNLETLIDRGVVPPLPPVRDVDLSLLRQEEEWTLFWVFLHRYPEVLSDVGRALATAPPVAAPKTPRPFPTHTLARFLHDLVHCFSGYYNRVHILPPSGTCGTEKTPAHLLPTLWARVYLLKGVHSVMKSCLSHLGVSPPSVM